MEEPKLKLKPDIVGGLIPHYLRWLWRFGVVAIIVYFGYKLLLWYLYPGQEYELLFLKLALIAIVIVASFIMIKHRIIRLHMTTYLFYENRFVHDYDLVMKKRKTVPYQQVRRVDHNQSLLQRTLNMADIVLVGADQDSDFTLLAIKNPEEVEHKIYQLMKMEEKYRFKSSQ